ETEEILETADTEENIEIEEVKTSDEPEVKVESSEEKEESRRRRPLLKPRTDEFVSKFEEIADASRSTDDEYQPRRRRRRYQEKEEPISNVELLEKLEYEIQPEYSDEDLEEIQARDAEYESEWYDEDIDFDEFEEYYD
ncbi:MAG: transcription termination/antitermination protein NusA, partial [Erysipelothrix sp.]|nr:transcription termination/antitermination protein NusA [Erysipelothrix sp.]